jgi:hypothetical protein
MRRTKGSYSASSKGQAYFSKCYLFFCPEEPSPRGLATKLGYPITTFSVFFPPIRSVLGL